MGQAVRMRTDYTAGEVRRLAKRTKDAGQARRLLAIAAVLDGASRTEAAEVGGLRDRSRRRTRSVVEAAAVDLDHVRARIRALSPQSTLDRGYAVVQRGDGLVVRDPDEATGPLHIRVARGEFEAERR